MTIREIESHPGATNLEVLKMDVTPKLITMAVNATTAELEASAGTPDTDPISLYVAVPDEWLRKGVVIDCGTNVLLDSKDNGRFIAHVEDGIDATQEFFENVLWIVLD